MESEDDILELLRKESAAVLKKAQRALIVQPGAIGDCILTLPLAAFLKKQLGLGSIDMLGHTEYIGIFPERSCIDRVLSIDSVELHRLFTSSDKFELADRDPLINVFAGYSWIVTFLGEPGSDFEANLIFTANCSYGSEVITLPQKPPKNVAGHLAEFQVEQFAAQSGLTLQDITVGRSDRLILASRSDRKNGTELLECIGIQADSPKVIIHPGSGGLKKSWYLDNMLAVAEELGSQGFVVVFLLGPAELERFSKDMVKKIRSVAAHICDLSLTQVVGLLSCAHAYIGNDSGITHLAAGLGIRTIAMFGPTNSAVYGPVGPAVTTFKGCGRTFSGKEAPKLQEKVLAALIPCP